MVAQDADVFAKERPDTREIGDVDSNRSFASIPQHVDCGVDVAEIVDFGKDGGNDLVESS